MALRINTNIPALGAQRNTRSNILGLNRSLNQLSSGLRINRAADDAAGLAIAELFQTRVRQGNIEARNIQQGISAVQTAEGGLSVQQEAVQRIRELSVQAANGTLSDENRQALQAEVTQLQEQINDVAQDTQYNDIQLLNQNQTIDLGTEGSISITLNESTTSSLNIDTLDISTQAGAQQAIQAADNALVDVARNRASLGAQQNRFERAITQREIQVENSAASESYIRDADFARIFTEQQRNQILLQGGLSALTQSNILPQTALSLLGN